MEMQNKDLDAILDQVSREKNLDKEILVDAMKQALISAARKKLGLQVDLEAEYYPEDGEIAVYEFRTIVREVRDNISEISFEDAQEEAKLEGQELSEEDIGSEFGLRLRSKEFGRIAAQTAKQVIFQKIREAERSTVFEEYKDRKDELVTGIARRFERGNVIVDLGRAEAIMPYREQVQRENIRAGDRVVAYVIDVSEQARGSQIVLSRTSPEMVRKLFEQEVPEIHEGIVDIVAVAREAGVRTKIAVYSRDPDVDPEGACIGLKGARVQAVVQELRGEKVDIVPFDEDDARFVCNALSPAQVTRVLVNEDEHSMQIVVPDDQLSLAIGRRGQNVRLAAQLSGWKIDITSETKMNEEREVAWSSLSKVSMLDDIQIQTLYNHGYRNAAELKNVDFAELQEVPGFSTMSQEDLYANVDAAIVLESEEKTKLAQAARDHAKILIKVNALCEKGELKLEDLEVVDAAAKVFFERVDIENASDLFMDIWEDRLEDYAGMPSLKAQQLFHGVAAMVSKADNDIANPVPALTDAELKEIESINTTLESELGLDAGETSEADVAFLDAGATPSGESESGESATI